MSKRDRSLLNATTTRRSVLAGGLAGAASLLLPPGLWGCAAPPDPDRERLEGWARTLRGERAERDAGASSTRVGELAAGTPYVAGTLEEYLRAGGSPDALEPLTLSLTRFDCVTLVESCLAIARAAHANPAPSWEAFGREVERMRYRGGVRGAYPSRLHYFSEWISDGAARGLVTDLGAELGGSPDRRPLRFMTEHRASYPGLSTDTSLARVAEMERSLDGNPRWVVPREAIPGVADRLRSGDILAFATRIEGLDVTHAAFAWRAPDGALRVLHAPLSGGVVEVTRSTLPEYVAAIRQCTGILVARPLWG